MKTRQQLISFSSIVALAGFVLSGPLGFAIVQFTKPLPAWTSVSAFVSNYHSIQNVPFYFGFILAGGMLVLAAAHYLNYQNEKDITALHILLSVAYTIVFAVLIFFNYICQTTFIPHLVNNYTPGYDPMIATFSMANPNSLSWAIEMWGYAFMGIATWLLSGFYRGKSKAIYALLIANGIISLLAVVLFIISVNWLLTTTGLVCYFIWNLLMIVLLIFIFRYAKNV